MADIQMSTDVNNSSFLPRRDVRDILSQKYFVMALPMTVFQILMSILGIFGNSVLLVICCRRKLRNSAMFYIGSLAVVDLFACVVVIPLQIVHSSRYYTYYDEIACKLFQWFKMSTLASSCLLFMAIALDRYKAICNPFKWRNAGRKRAVIKATACILTGIIFTTPELILVGGQEYSVNQTISRFNFSRKDIPVMDLNQSCHICEHLNSYSGTWELKTFFAAAVAIFTILVAVAIVCYSRIAISMRASRKNFSEASVHMDSTIQQEPLRKVDKNPVECRSTEITESTFSERNSDHDSQSSVTDTRKDSIGLEDSKDRILRKVFRHQRSPLKFSTNLSRGSNLHSRPETLSISSSLGRHHNGVRKSTLDNTKQFDVAKALMIVTIVFLITWLPYWIIGIYGLIFPAYHITSSSSVVTVLAFLEQLFFLNNAVNPLVYLMYSGEFRHHCRQIFQITKSRRR